MCFGRVARGSQRSQQIAVVDHAAQPRQDAQMFVVARGTDQEKDISQPPLVAERDAARRNAKRKMASARMLPIGRRGCKSATPLSERCRMHFLARPNGVRHRLGIPEQMRARGQLGHLRNYARACASC